MDHHTDHVFGQAHRFRGFFVDDGFDHLDFQEVVSRAQRSALTAASFDRTIADVVWFRSGQAAASFGELNVVVSGESSSFEERDAFAHQLPKFRLGESVLAFSARAGGDVLEQSVDQTFHVRLDVLVKQVRAKQPHSAVDVVPDAAGRDDSAFVGIGRADAADRESVAPVDVRHGQAGELDPWQSGDIGYLVRSLIVTHLLD